MLQTPSTARRLLRCACICEFHFSHLKKKKKTGTVALKLTDFLGILILHSSSQGAWTSLPQCLGTSGGLVRDQQFLAMASPKVITFSCWDQ